MMGVGIHRLGAQGPLTARERGEQIIATGLLVSTARATESCSVEMELPSGTDSGEEGIWTFSTETMGEPVPALKARAAPSLAGF